MSLRLRRAARALRKRYGVGCVEFSDDEVTAMRMTGPPNLRTAIECMGCEDLDDDYPCDAVVRWLTHGHSGRGVYVHCGEYPEEGSVCIPMSLGQVLAIARAT